MLFPHKKQLFYPHKEAKSMVLLNKGQEILFA